MKRICLAFLILYSVRGLAHPTSFEGGLSLMAELHPEIQEVSTVYSPKYWLGLGVISMRSPDLFEFQSLHLGWLVRRWNLPEAQGNFYLLGGAGHADLKNVMSGGAYRLGAQADFETRRIYTFTRYVEHRFFDRQLKINDQFSAALGFAPYLGEFDELNSWVIFKVVARNEFADYLYMPLLRFFYKNLLWELGQDFDGNTQVNFMVRF